MDNTSKSSPEPQGDGATERYQQAMIDADIEGLPRSPEIDEMIAEWDREGVDHEEQIRRLKLYFKKGRNKVTAAE